MPPIKLGELLVKARVLTDAQLKAALAEQQKWGGKLGEILVRMNALTEDMLVKALSKQTGITSVNLDSIESIPAQVKSKISAQMARDLAVLPLQLRDEGRTLIVAMADPTQLNHIDTLRKVSRCRIQVQLAGRSAIAKAYGRFYEGEAEMSSDDGADGGMKFVDAQGNTVNKSREQIEADHFARTGRRATLDQPAVFGPNPPRTSASTSQAAAADPAQQVQALEDVQRKEVAALRSMVELLIQKGVFTREEYLAKVKR
jgi:Type II secretion system (T2SS), protein E, N-terminal domain